MSVWNWQIDAPIHSRLPYVSRTRVELDVLGMIIEKGFDDMSCVCVCEHVLHILGEQHLQLMM